MQPKQPLPNAVPVFVLGLLSILSSWFFFGLIFAIIALVMSKEPLKLLRAEPDAYADGGLFNAGRILSIIGLSISAAATLFWLIAIIMMLFVLSAMPEAQGFPECFRVWDSCFDTLTAL